MTWSQEQLDAVYARRRAEQPSIPARVQASALGMLSKNAVVQPAGKPKPPRGMNKLEAAYAGHLTIMQACGEIRAWRFEAIKVRLAKGAMFKPDFLVWMPDGSLEFHETKGFWRESARVRIKVAADLYPMFSWRGVTKPRGGNWTYEVFG